MANLKVYSIADGDLFIDFVKKATIKNHSITSVQLEPGQYFVRLSTRNPLLYIEEVVNVAGDCVFQARKEDFLSKLTETQLNELQYVSKQQNNTQWVEELYSGMPVSNEYDKVGKFQDGMCVVWKNNLCGFINRRGEEIIPCKFEDFGLTRGGLSTVQLNKKWGAVNSQGEFKIPLHYDFCKSRKGDDYWDVSKDGRWEWEIDGLYYQGGKWGLCDKNGTEIVPCRFADQVRAQGEYFVGRNALLSSSVSVINPNGVFLFSEIDLEELRTIPGDPSIFLIKQGGKWGIIGLNGRYACSPQYDTVDGFNNNLCPVKKNDKWGIINKSGSLIQQCIFDKIERDSVTGNYKTIIDKKYGALNSSAESVLQCQYENVSFIGSNFIVKLSNKYGVTDYRGSLIIATEYDSINRSADSAYYFCKKNGVYGVIDYKGRQRVPFAYSSIKGPYDDSFIVEVQKSYGLLSTDGVSITGIVYDAIEYRSGLGFCFKLNGLWGVMNSYGRVSLQAHYYYIGPYSNGLFPVNVGGHKPEMWQDMGRALEDQYPGNVEGGQWGFIDSSQEVIPAQFDACYPFGDKYTVVRKNKMMGVIDKSGKIIVPIRFSYCSILSDTLFMTAEESRITQGDSEYDLMFEDAPVIHNVFGMPQLSMCWNGDYNYFVKGGKYGLFSIGKEVIPPLYESIRANKDRTLFLVKKDGKYGIIDKTGETIIACINDSLELL